MFLNRIATDWGVVIALVLVNAIRCEGQLPDPASLSLEEAEFIQPAAFQPSTAIPEPIANPIGNGIDLAGLCDLALVQSPKLSVQRAKVGESQMRALATGLFPNPVVQGGGKNVSGGDSGLAIGIDQELPVNGARKLERQATTLLYSAERATLEREIQVMISEIESAYIEVLAADELVAVDRRGLEVTGESLRLVSENYNAGLVSALPYGLARSQHGAARKALQVSEGNFQTARRALAGLLAMEEASLPNVAGELHAPLLPPDLEVKSLRRPDLQAASLRVQAAQSSTDAARRMRIPNPTLGYQREEADETENIFTIGMEIPVFNNGVPRVRERMAGLQVASKEKSALAQTVQNEVEVAASRLGSAREAVSIYENEIRPSIDESLEAANVAFQSGTTDMSLLLQTQASLIEHERNYIRTLQELRDSEIAYKLATGAQRESFK
jgi:cobalt-zinc-cadmium efflux system outer membrane protein